MSKTYGWIVLALLASGCGYSVSGAREAYAQKQCALALKCDDVGSGKRYASTDECLIRHRADALTLWPTNTCEGKINSEALDRCLKTIEISQCADSISGVLDLANIVAKCNSGEVCR